MFDFLKNLLAGMFDFDGNGELDDFELTTQLMFMDGFFDGDD